MKNIVILGSTGSIGTNSLDVIKNNEDRYKAIGLSAKSNSVLLAEQCKDFNIEAASLWDSSNSKFTSSDNTRLQTSGMDGLLSLVDMDYDILVNSLVGAVGIEPTYRAAQKGCRIALANKESLVAAGDLINRELKKSGGEIIPVDSEHSAIFQCLHGNKDKEVEKIIITASGGPFRNLPANEFANITPKQALKHPTWDMGAKISIDSATMVNKGLEVIEAHHLFDIPYEKIEVLVHPQSIIHSMVCYVDGSILAHLGLPDMRIPIQYALSYPKKIQFNSKRLDFAELGSLTFENPDPKRFPCIELAYKAGKTGGSLPCVMNAANEIAVDAFLNEKISFLQIPELIAKAMDTHNVVLDFELNDILEIDIETRRRVKEWVH